MRPRRQPDLLGQHTVTGRRAVVRPVQPHDLGQHMRITGVRLRPRHRVAFSVPGRLQRVDRIDGVAGRDQRLDPWAAVGLDSDQHLVRLGALGQMVTDQAVQHRQPRYPLRKPAPHQQPALIILDLDVVMGLGPVIADEQHLLTSPASERAPTSRSRRPGRPNGAVLDPV